MASNVPPMSPPPPQPPVPPQYPAPGKKKTSVWVWVGLGCGSLILICIVAVVGFFWYVAKHPVSMAARALTLSNPGVEVVTTDESARRVTFREKATGKTVTMSLEDLKAGKIVFEGDGEKVTLSADAGGITAETADGKTAVLGGGGAVKLPSWFPAYPGSTPTGTFSVNDAASESAGFSFTTSGSAADVLKFYENEFKQAGLTVSVTGTLVVAKDEAGDREATITVISVPGSDVRVHGTFKSKK